VSQIQIEPLCNEVAPRPLTFAAGKPAPSPPVAQRPRPCIAPQDGVVWRGNDRRFKIGHCERNDSKTGRLDSSAPAMSGAETPTRCITLPPLGVLNYDGLSSRPQLGPFLCVPTRAAPRGQNWYSIIGQLLDVVGFLIIAVDGIINLNATTTGALVSFRKPTSNRRLN
jgi:hypothetical protein